VGDEVAVAVAHGRPDLGVAARGVRLHLRPQVDAVAVQKLPVGLADRLQGLLAPLALGRPLEDLERLPEAADLDRLEELPLRAEQAEHVGLRDAGSAGDVVRRCAVEALVGELDEGGVEDLLPPLVLRLPFRDLDHALDVSDYSQPCQAPRPRRRDRSLRAAYGTAGRARARTPGSPPGSRPGRGRRRAG